jgi:hypothetical protein
MWRAPGYGSPHRDAAVRDVGRRCARPPTPTPTSSSSFPARGTGKGNTDLGLVVDHGVCCGSSVPSTAPSPRRRRSSYRLTLILMRIGVFWIPPAEFRISKTPLSTLLVPEFTIRRPLGVARSLTVLVSPGGTFTTAAANRILLRTTCAASRSLSRARGTNAKSVTRAVHEIPTALHVSRTRHCEPLHSDGRPSSRPRPRVGVTGPTAALVTVRPGEGPLWATGVTWNLISAPSSAATRA